MGSAGSTMHGAGARGALRASDSPRWLAPLLALAISLGTTAVRAHEEIVPPEPIEVVEGVWPPGPPATHDVVVQLLVEVSAQGRVTEAAVDVTLGPELDAAALEAARKWRFVPARRAGEPVAARARIAVRFRGAERSRAPLASNAESESDATSAPAPSATSAARPAYEAVARVAEPPRSASEVTRERAVIAAAPHRTGEDVLRVVPGLFVTQHGGEGKAGQIFYRGFDADHGQDLEIWVGGAPVNEVSNIHGQGYADLNFVMPEVVRAVRVQPGPYDPRQGDFAVAGTVRLELGYDEPGVTAKAGYGSFDARRYFLAFRPRGSDDGTFAAAEFYETDGFGPSRAAHRASAIAQGSFRLGDAARARLLLTGYASQFDTAGVVRLADLRARAISRYGTYDPRQGGASTRVSLVGEITRETEGSALSVAPFVVLRGLWLRQNFTGFLLDPRDGDLTQQRNDDVVFGGTASFRLNRALFSPRDAFEVGMLVRADRIEQSQKRLAASDRRVTRDEVAARVQALDVAAYLDVALHPLSMLSLRGGLRVDGLSYVSEDEAQGAGGQARSAHGAHLGKKVSLELTPRSGLRVLASYGEGFRSPQARYLAEGEPAPFTRVRAVECGTRYAREDLAVSVAGFATLLSNDLVFDPASVGYREVPATLRAGATLDASYRPLPWLMLTVGSTYTRSTFRASRGEYVRGERVPYVPSVVSRADLALAPVLARFSGRALRGELGSGASYLAQRSLPGGRRGHDVFLLDAQARVRWGELALSLRVLNLLGSDWYDSELVFASSFRPGQESASLVPVRHVTVGAPRTLLASVEIYL